MDRSSIERLSDEYERKRLVFECHQQLNVWGKTEIERQEMARKYHVAEAEMLQAKANLEAAKRPLSSPAVYPSEAQASPGYGSGDGNWR